MRKTILWCASDLIQHAVYLNQGKFLSRPKCHADVLQYTFSFQAFIPHRPRLWKLLIPPQQALALRDASRSRVQKLNQFASANVSSLVTVLDTVPCTMQNQVKVTVFIFKSSLHWNWVFKTWLKHKDKATADNHSPHVERNNISKAHRYWKQGWNIQAFKSEYQTPPTWNRKHISFTLSSYMGINGI